jgi:pimeloyl-ACP methyl ester carboxylesterase
MHPASGSADSWRFQQEPFASAGFRCITHDLRGWGRSKREANSDPGCMSDDLAALADHLGLEQFVLVGAAYGGFGALDYALRYSNRLQALVLSGTQAGIADPTYSALRDRVVSPPIRQLPLEFRELGSSYRARDPEGVKQWLEISHGEGGADARQRMCMQVALPMLGDLKMPIQLIAGAADLLAPPALMRTFAAHMPGARFSTVSEAGHCIHWEEPDEWNRIVLAFLGDVF